MSDLKRIWPGTPISLPAVGLKLCRVLKNRLLTHLNSALLQKTFFPSGKGLRIHHTARISYPGSIKIGNNVFIGEQCRFYSELPDGKLDIASDVQIGEHCEIDFSGVLSIGQATLVSSHVVIYSHSHGLDPRNYPSPRQVTIEENVWIGSRSIINSNVTRIGKNSVIAAGSVVVKEVPPNTIVGGNPAVVLRTL